MTEIKKRLIKLVALPMIVVGVVLIIVSQLPIEKWRQERIAAQREKELNRKKMAEIISKGGYILMRSEEENRRLRELGLDPNSIPPIDPKSIQQPSQLVWPQSGISVVPPGSLPPGVTVIPNPLTPATDERSTPVPPPSEELEVLATADRWVDTGVYPIRGIAVEITPVSGKEEDLRKGVFIVEGDVTYTPLLKPQDQGIRSHIIKFVAGGLNQSGKQLKLRTLTGEVKYRIKVFQIGDDYK